MLILVQFGLGIALVLPLIYYLGVCAFIYTYAAYPVIKKYMIDPVDNANKNNGGPNGDLALENGENMDENL